MNIADNVMFKECLLSVSHNAKYLIYFITYNFLKNSMSQSLSLLPLSHCGDRVGQIM